MTAGWRDTGAMSRRCALVGLALAAGCNWVYDLPRTDLFDARYLDAPIDAPFECPTSGEPKFGANLVQALAQDCTFYSESIETRVAIGICGRGTESFIASGELDGNVLTPVTLIGGSSELSHARITPEGDELWILRGGLGISVYSRVDDTRWTFVRDLSLPPGVTPGQNDALGSPSRKIAGKRRIIYYSFASFVLRELVDDGTVTTLVASYAPQALNALYIVFPNLTADGLRLVFSGEPANDTKGNATMYSARATVADAFGPAIRLTTAPVAHDPHLREDCSRLYSWGLSSVFFAPQRL